VNFAEYERLKATLEVLSDPGLMAQIRKSRRFYQLGKRGLSFEEVCGEPLRRAGGKRSATTESCVSSR